LRFLVQTSLAALGVLTGLRSPALARGLRRPLFPLEMQGNSMVPTLRNGEMLQVDRAAYSHARPRRGDIVIFAFPPVTSHGLRFLVKRVVGLPGEEVRVERGHVFIDGHALSEPYVQIPAAYYYPPRRVPSGSYFLLGDNRNNSMDSHLFGPIPRANIAGKVILARRG
jgi:signal peptidase I